MKIYLEGEWNPKRAQRLIIEASGDLEEILLYQKFLDLQQQPPALEEWYSDVLKCLKDGPKTTNQIAEMLGINNTTCNNRIARLHDLNLVSRKPHLVRNRTTRGFVYSLNVQIPDDLQLSDTIERDDS